MYFTLIKSWRGCEISFWMISGYHVWACLHIVNQLMEGKNVHFYIFAVHILERVKYHISYIMDKICKKYSTKENFGFSHRDVMNKRYSKPVLDTHVYCVPYPASCSTVNITQPILPLLTYHYPYRLVMTYITFTVCKGDRFW